MKNVIFIAPPSAGKGTQSSILIERGYEHISTGDMLREEINKKSTIGLEIESIMQSGKLVSDEIVYELIKNKLTNLNKPFILDGYPRTINQAKLLDKLFKELNINDYEVIYLDITLEEALERALGRLTCECGASYSKYNAEFKPKVDGICDKCGKKLISRSDDNEESFKIRFTTFNENVLPIKDFYQQKEKLHIINTELGKDKIAEEIKDILK